MYKKIINKIKNFDLNKINIFVCLISFIIYLISIYLVKNIYLLIIIYSFLFILYNKINYKIVEFLVYMLGILLISYIFINLLNLNIFILDYKKIFMIVIKLFYFFSYFFILVFNIKNKRKEYLKIRKGKKYTFKELRNKKYNQFKNNELVKINDFIDKQKINNSEYEKIIRDNLSNLTDEELDKYIWVNYLRFYKNQKKQKNNNISKSDLVFLSIHGIILLLSFLVR